MSALEELEPQPKPDSVRPTVYETQVNHAIALNSQMRGAPATIRLIASAERDRDHMQRVLGESGIEVVSLDKQPADLGFEERKFVALGERMSLDEIVEQARTAVPDLGIVAKTPLSESLDDETRLPFVLKRPLHDTGGVNKFLVTRPDQVEKLALYCEERKYISDNWVTEPYIKTPGDVNSSYRLVVTATGLIIASALLYKSREAGKKAEAPFVTKDIDLGPPFTPRTERKNEDGWVDFADRDSEWFLDADAVTSNVASGGRIIPLKIAGELGTKQQLTETERAILNAHGIDDLETPKQLLNATEALGRRFGPRIGLILGIDFLQDHEGRCHFLELNPYPGTDSILTWWGLDPDRGRNDRSRQDRISNDLLRVVGDSLRKLVD